MTPEPRDLRRGLDPRERAVLVATYEHKVLLTEHLKAISSGRFDAPRIDCLISRSAGS